MMETCCSTLGSVVMPDISGFNMLWVSTNTLADAW